MERLEREWENGCTCTALLGHSILLRLHLHCIVCVQYSLLANCNLQVLQRRGGGISLFSRKRTGEYPVWRNRYSGEPIPAQPNPTHGELTWPPSTQTQLWGEGCRSCVVGRRVGRPRPAAAAAASSAFPLPYKRDWHPPGGYIGYCLPPPLLSFPSCASKHKHREVAEASFFLPALACPPLPARPGLYPLLLPLFLSSLLFLRHESHKIGSDRIKSASVVVSPFLLSPAPAWQQFDYFVCTSEFLACLNFSCDCPSCFPGTSLRSSFQKIRVYDPLFRQCWGQKQNAKRLPTLICVITDCGRINDKSLSTTTAHRPWTAQFSFSSQYTHTVLFYFRLTGYMLKTLHVLCLQE